MASELFTADVRQANIRRVESAWRDVFRPPKKQTVSEWAEDNLVLSERETATPGPIRFSRTPYLREIINNFQDDRIKEVTFVSGTQSGKTIGIFVALSWIVAESPGQTLLVLPTETLAKSINRNRIEPMFEDCPTIKRLIPKDRKQYYTTLEKVFSRCTINTVGSNSPANLASRPCRIILLDEIDKQAEATEKEAGAIDLAIERTKTFWNHKVVKTSTPTTDEGAIWRSFLSGDQRYFYVPCPHCQFMQQLVFEQVKFAKHKDAEGVYDIPKTASTAYYECAQCRGRIEDKHKRKMLNRGEWRPSQPSGSHRSYHLSSLYPTWVRWADVVAKFLDSKDYPDSLRNFRNSWLALPWERLGSANTEEEIASHVGDYHRGECPDDPLAVILTADVQGDTLWWCIRAWCAHETSYLIDYGQAMNLQELLHISQSIYESPSGDIRITHAAIDSGYMTKEVYEFCAQHKFIPIKGRGRGQQSQPVKMTLLKDFGIQLMSIDVDSFKDHLQDKIKQPLGAKGSWYLPQETCGIYASHLTSEIRTMRRNKKTGFDSLVWEKIKPANHLLDAEVYQIGFATMLRIRQQAPLEKPQIQPPPPKPKPAKPSSVQEFTRPDGRAFFDLRRQSW